MFENVAHLQEQILDRPERNFISRYLFDTVPYIFNDNIDTWIRWKSDLGEKIDVDPRDIVLTGSAAIGYSLNPHKKFRKFGSLSDVDVGIISDYYFSISWRYLRQRRVEWLTLEKNLQNAIESHRKNHVFAGTIAADAILPLLPFGLTWQSALDEMSSVEPTAGRDIKLRIYKDFDSLRSYQCVGIRKARGTAAQGAAAETEIATEDN